MHSSPGMKYYELLSSHLMSQEIFIGNYNQLKSLLEYIHDPRKSLPFSSSDNEEKERGIQTDIVRLFHNYVASAMTLVEHTRILKQNDSLKVEFRKEYQTKVDTIFANDPLSRFVQDMRNYFLHRGLPLTGMQVSWNGKSHQVDTRVFLDISKMRDWNGWHGSSKAYLAEAKDELTLLEIIESYTKKVQEFHLWFVEWYMNLHKTELDDFRRIQEQWNKGMEILKHNLNRPVRPSDT